MSTQPTQLEIDQELDDVLRVLAFSEVVLGNKSAGARPRGVRGAQPMATSLAANESPPDVR